MKGQKGGKKKTSIFSILNRSQFKEFVWLI